MNVEVLEKNMNEVLSAFTSEEVLYETLFIRGGLSNYILDQDIESLEVQFPDSQVQTIEGAGHWIHAEAPEEFTQSLLSFLLR